MEITADAAYEQHARRNPADRPKFLGLAHKAFGLDAFARIEYYDRPEDMGMEWVGQAGDWFDLRGYLADEMAGKAGMITIPTYTDHVSRKVVPAKFGKAVNEAGKGHLSVCFVFGRGFEHFCYPDFMSVLVDHEHDGHANIYRHGIGFRGRNTDAEEFWRLSETGPECKTALYHIVSELLSHSRQLQGGRFSGVITPEMKKWVSESYLGQYTKLWSIPETPFRDDLIAWYFHGPWIGHGMARIENLGGRMYLHAKRGGKQLHLPAPNKLLDRVML